MALVADAAGKVDEDEVEAAPPHLGAEEVGALRVERHRHRRLAHPPALRLAAPEQAVGLEVAHDDRDGLRREAGIRAISDFASAPCRRTRLRTSRSFCARIPAWLVPR